MSLSISEDLPKTVPDGMDMMLQNEEVFNSFHELFKKSNLFLLSYIYFGSIGLSAERQWRMSAVREKVAIMTQQFEADEIQ